MMLNQIRNLISDTPDRQSFFAYVNRLFPSGSRESQLISRAYSTAEREFAGILREGNGEQYFGHLRAVALILMVYLRVRDANQIAAALLHDIIENIPGWTYERVVTEYNHEVAIIVWWVTKPDLQSFDGDREARNRAYHRNLNEAPRVAIILKLADRLHNMLTLWGVDLEKQRRKISETKDYYVNFAEKEIVFIHELEAAMVAAESGLHTT